MLLCFSVWTRKKSLVMEKVERLTTEGPGVNMLRYVPMHLKLVEKVHTTFGSGFKTALILTRPGSSFSVFKIP